MAAVALVVAMSSGSSHREAPLTSIDPTADDTDVYAFVAPDATDSLTLIANWIPFEDPAGGPNFYRFDDRATYYLNIDNTGDGDYDVRYRFSSGPRSATPTRSSTRCRACRRSTIRSSTSSRPTTSCARSYTSAAA